jgi:hypothetical protein
LEIAQESAKEANYWQRRMVIEEDEEQQAYIDELVRRSYRKKASEAKRMRSYASEDGCGALLQEMLSMIALTEDGTAQ